MEMYISEWVDSDGRRHVLYLPLSLDEIPLGDFYSQALELIEEKGAPRTFPEAPRARRSPLQRILNWLCSPLAYGACHGQDVKD